MVRRDLIRVCEGGGGLSMRAPSSNAPSPRNPTCAKTHVADPAPATEAANVTSTPSPYRDSPFLALKRILTSQQSAVARAHCVRYAWQLLLDGVRRKLGPYSIVLEHVLERICGERAVERA